MRYKNKVEVPGETIYEMITAEDNAGFGLAVADIHESQPHHHHFLLEIYILLYGALEVRMDSRLVVLAKQGDVLTISPPSRHFAKSVGPDPARVIVITLPPWRPDDHHLEGDHQHHTTTP